MRTTSIVDDPSIGIMWSYGSNMSVEQMARRCPAAQKLAALVCRGRLVFRGVADVTGARHEDLRVAGGLWAITPACEAELDRYEGVERGTYLKRYFRLRVNGRDRWVLFYKMNAKGVMPPTLSYLNTIIRGYHDFGLEDRLPLLESAVRDSWERARATPYLRYRHARTGNAVLARVDDVPQKVKEVN